MSNQKYNTQSFKDSLSKIFPNVELVSEFKTIKTHVLVKTNYGVCKVIPDNILRGRIPTIVSAINKTEYFKNQLKEIFPDLKVINSYEDDMYYIQVQDKLGIYNVKKNHLLTGHYPTIMSVIDKESYFIKKAREIHNDKYEYNSFIYINHIEKSLVWCNICEKYFPQNANNHLNGKGCKKCGKRFIQLLNQDKSTGWSYENWIQQALISKNFDSFKCYIFRCWNEDEHFYKIGKTFQTLKKRFGCFNDLPYNYELVELVINEGRYISELENILKKEHKEYKYIPKKKFTGMYECFSNINLDLINKITNNGSNFL